MKALQCFMLLLCFCHATSASSDSSHVYLQRGKPGEIPNPHVTGDSTNEEQITSAFWYKGESLLISSWEGKINTPSTKYFMTKNFSLIVNNVTDTDGGQYISRVVQNQQILPDSSVNVTIFVSPSEPAPWIEECGVPKDHNDYCMMQLPSEETEYHLTCHVTGARPPVDLHLWRVRADGSSEAVQQVLRRVQREDSSQNGAIGRDQALFSTSLFFNGTFHGNTTLLCVATGLAMGGNRGGSAVQVHISKPPDEAHVPSTAKLKTDVGREGTERLVLEGITIAALCVVAVVILAVVVKKTVCRMERVLQAMPRELQPFLSKGPSTEDRLASELKTFYVNEMGTIPTHPSEFAVSMKTEDIFVLPGLSRVTNKTREPEKVTMNLEGSTIVYLDVPDKEPLQSLDELLQILIDNQHAVVVGNPGCSKSSLITKFAYDFAKGGFNSYFKYVIILRRKEIHNSTGVLDAMHRLLPSETQISKQGLRNVISKHQKEVLIIVDGAFLLEALSDATRMSVSNDDISFEELLSVKGLISCSILVTACPHQLHQLQSYYSSYTVVEATGLSKEHSTEYIHKFFSSDSSKADALWRVVQSDAYLTTLAQSPLTLQVLCRIWQTRNKLPEQVTELYDKILDAKVNNLQRKYGIAKPQMDSLKKDMGRVAYGGLTDPEGERRVFSPEEFPATTLEKGLKIGVLSRETRTSEEGTVCIVKYLHLYQDYFAAYYLSTDPATLLPKVCGETIQRNEHLLRFCREMSHEAARIIDELHRQG